MVLATNHEPGMTRQPFASTSIYVQYQYICCYVSLCTHYCSCPTVELYEVNVDCTPCMYCTKNKNLFLKFKRNRFSQHKTATITLFNMANKLKPGSSVEIFGLQGAKELNGKQGILVEYYETGQHTGRWKVRLTERSPVAVKTANLKLDVSDGKYQKFMAKPMPEMNDLWGITDTSHLDIPMLTEIADRETTLELKERAIFVALNGGDESYEAFRFVLLYPYGTGCYAQTGQASLRYEDYVQSLLRHSSGLFLNNSEWIAFSTKRVAEIRAVTGEPPFHVTEYNDDGNDFGEPKYEDALKLLSRTYPQKTFCLRYICGDKHAAFIASIMLHDLWNSLRSKRMS